MGLKLKWAPSERGGVDARAGGYTLHVRDNPSLADMMARRPGWEWSVNRHEWFVPVGSRDPKAPHTTCTTQEAAQEAAEAALARLLAEDEGLRALLVGQWRDPEKLEADNARALAWLEERDALRARVTELERASRWIPVGESMPDDGVPVLVFNDIGTQCIATVMLDFGRRVFYGHGHFPGPVTHWRPLPAGPEVEK